MMSFIGVSPEELNALQFWPWAAVNWAELANFEIDFEFWGHSSHFKWLQSSVAQLVQKLQVPYGLFWSHKFHRERWLVARNASDCDFTVASATTRILNPNFLLKFLHQKLIIWILRQVFYPILQPGLLDRYLLRHAHYPKENHINVMLFFSQGWNVNVPFISSEPRRPRPSFLIFYWLMSLSFAKKFVIQAPETH